LLGARTCVFRRLAHLDGVAARQTRVLGCVQARLGEQALREPNLRRIFGACSRKRIRRRRLRLGPSLRTSQKLCWPFRPPGEGATTRGRSSARPRYSRNKSRRTRLRRRERESRDGFSAQWIGFQSRRFAPSFRSSRSKMERIRRRSFSLVWGMTARGLLGGSRGGTL
jgi:hypothetical protein